MLYSPALSPALALAIALAPALAARLSPPAPQLAITTASIHVEFAASRLEFQARECHHRIQLEKLCLATYFQLWGRFLKREIHRFRLGCWAARRGVADAPGKGELRADSIEAKSLKPYLLREDGRELYESNRNRYSNTWQKLTFLALEQRDGVITRSLSSINYAYRLISSLEVTF